MVDAEQSEILERMREGVRRIEEANAAAEDRSARYEQLTDQLAAIEATRTSADQAVTVTAGQGGSIRDIRFGPGAVRLSPPKLSEVVMATLRQAVSEAAQQQANSLADVVGDKYDLLERVAQAQQVPPQQTPPQQASTQQASTQQAPAQQAPHEPRTSAPAQRSAPPARPWWEDDGDDEYDPFAWR